MEVRKMWTLRAQALHEPTLTGVEGRQTQKTRPCLRDGDRGRGAVSLPDKPTGGGADNRPARPDFNASGLADASKLAISLSLRSPGKSTHGADNERSPI